MYVKISCNKSEKHNLPIDKVRYRQPEQWATITPMGNDAVHIVFDIPQRAITPGQAAVLYDGDIVLGGGTIIS